MKTMKRFLSLTAISLALFVTANAHGAAGEARVTLREISARPDLVLVEFLVASPASSEHGASDGCPSSQAVLLDQSGSRIGSGADDFTYCRLDDSGRYLITHFLYTNGDPATQRPDRIQIDLDELQFVSGDGDGSTQPAPPRRHEFKVPVRQDDNGRVFPTLASAASGLRMALRRADFGASLAKVDACLSLPDPGDWKVNAHLLVGERQIPMEYWTIPHYREPGVLESSNRCYTMIFSDSEGVIANARRGSVVFVVDKIARNMPECVDATRWELIRDELARFGVGGDLDGAGNYCFAGGLQQLTSPEINAHLTSYVEAALREEVAGPLVLPIR